MRQQHFFQVALASLGTVFLSGLNVSPANSQTIDVASFQNAILFEHNDIRSWHNTAPLTLNSSLNNSAQAHAEYLTSIGQLEHSSDGFGENVYVMYSSGSISTNEVNFATQVANAWYEESDEYNYSNPGFSSSTGHFTQMVWNDTTDLGCGIAEGDQTISGNSYKAIYVVCQYNPPGNVWGTFDTNVFAP